ncbi:MAG: hypothetical protein LBU51_02635 [Bacteroidales bacterium]|nr:hypothetical protein [Bacteroidales bacterium]
MFNRHFNGEIAAQAMALVATDVRRFGFFDGLLGTLPVANLQTLWDNLRAPTAIENTVKQISDQALLAEVDRMATNGGGGFAVGGGAGIHDIGASNANYVAAIGQIQTEVVNRHMPILIFQNPRGQRHACVVVQTLTLPGGIIVLRAYNPRGHRFDILSDKRISDMGAGGEENWNLVQYITFNY